jgi:hypothetical protein
MSRDIFTSDAIDDELRAKLDEARERYVQDPTLKNRAAYQQAVRVFSNWVLYEKRPEDSQ